MNRRAEGVPAEDGMAKSTKSMIVLGIHPHVHAGLEFQAKPKINQNNINIQNRSWKLIFLSLLRSGGMPLFNLVSGRVKILLDLPGNLVKVRLSIALSHGADTGNA
jgi:hypothetical protein